MRPTSAKPLDLTLVRERARAAKTLLSPCQLCPHGCGAKRDHGETGRCGLSAQAVVSSAFPHKGEEECLSGQSGSGTIFFSGCNLSCVYCQNADLSRDREGLEITPSCLAAQMIALQMAGCHNLNLVSPTHVVPQILDALALAVEQGFHLPIVYNTGGYDLLETLHLLEGVVDIYMPDFKYSDNATAERYSSAPDYFTAAQDALREMHRQVGDLQMNDEGLAVSGLLVRHLVLPEGLAGTREAMRFLADDISQNTAVNIMGQYRPAGDACLHPKIDRAVNLEEIIQAKRIAQDAGLTRVL